MINKQYFRKIRKKIADISASRREVIVLSAEAQQLAKKSIFALQRDDYKIGKELLIESMNNLKKINKFSKLKSRLEQEGSYRAAQEEYVEAKIFYQFLNNEVIDEISDMPIEDEIYLAGLCDVPGELYRYAIKSATEKNISVVKKCYELAQVIIMELVDMNLTGYHRQKFDQAKQSLYKLEQILYEVSIKNL